MENENSHETLAKKLADKINSYKCLICLDLLKNIRELPCKHVFCANCLESYKEKNAAFVCPVCKADIPRRKILSRDSALDGLCGFLKNLRSDVRVHYNCDLLDILSATKTTSVSKSDSDIIQQSSEEIDFIPATAKPAKKITPKTKRTRKVTPKNKNAKKPKANVTKQLPILTCQPSTSKQPYIIFNDQNGGMHESEVKILRWLHDNRNDFERTSQTQKTPSENETQQDIELPSVSQQMIKKVYRKSKLDEKSNTLKQVQSLEKLKPSSGKRALECTTSSRLRQYHEFTSLESMKNDLIIEFVEDEVLNVIDKEVGGDAGKKARVPRKKPTNNEGDIEMIDIIEDEVLNAIDKEASALNTKKTVESSKRRGRGGCKKLDTDLGNDSIQNKQKPWPSINKFKKSLGTIPKTKINKKPESPPIEAEQNKENINSNIKIDFDKMEEYFTRVIPKLIEGNIPLTSPDLSLVANTDKKVENVENMDEEELNDIYIQSTQLLSVEKDAGKFTGTDILQYAKKLQSLLIPQDQSVTDQNIIDEVFPIIERIFIKLKSQTSNKSQRKCDISGILSTFSDKEIQTDSFYRELFNMPSDSALNKLNKDANIHTDAINVNCCNSNIEKITISHEKSTDESFYSINPGNEALEKAAVVTNTSPNGENMEISCEKRDETTKNESKIMEIDSNLLPESEMQIEEILEKCRTQNDSTNMKPDERTIEITEIEQRHDENDCEMKKNAEYELQNSQLNSSQGSKIIYSIPSLQTKVNRKLMFQRAMTERQESLKNMPTMNSNDETNDFCNRFLNKDISIQFESENQNFSEVIKEKTNTPKITSQGNKISTNPDVPVKIAETQFDTQLLDYCEELIEKANRPIVSGYQKEINISPKPIDTQISQKYGKIKTQDLLKHCDELIEMSNQKNTREKEEKTNNIKYGNSQIPSTSIGVEYKQVDDIGTQALLDHCNALIEKTTKVVHTEEEEDIIDDETLCKNLDKLDNVLLHGDKCLVVNDLTDTFFQEKTADNKLMNDSFDTLCEQITFPSQKRKLSNDHNNESTKRIKVLQNICIKDDPKSDDFNISDDEMFHDVDVIETTPQKQKHSVFLDRLSCSQALPRLQTIDEPPIVPPPPGFDDADENMNVESDVAEILTQMESENIIPNSLSPEKPPRKPSSSIMNSTVMTQNVAGSSQIFKELSPIRNVDKKNLNVIELAQKSKFSPLTILPKEPPIRSPLTSTPKQKSILNYAKVISQKNITQEPSSLTPKTKPCIAFTRLNQSETMSVYSLCNKKLATCEKVFGPRVTHMIVSVDKNNYVKDHTIKLVSAIAAGIWVLNTKWIEQCLGQNVIVDEEPYEVLDTSGIPSPRISRLTRTTNPLFKGFKFFLSPPFANATIQDIKNIIKLLAGVFVSSIEDLLDSENQICLVISDVLQTEDYDKFEDILEKYKIATVDMNWLSLSVCRYKILSMKPYLLCSDDSLEGLGYPPELLVDVPPSIT